jgi:hypothetical protein
MSAAAAGAVCLVPFVTCKHWLPAAKRDVATAERDVEGWIKKLEQRAKTAEAKLKALGHGGEDDVDKLIASAKQVA